MLALFLMSLTVIVPLGLCHRKAQKAHDPVHVGMTVVEVLYAVRNCDIFPARSDFPRDDDAEPDNILAIHLGRSSDGTFWTYDLAAGRDVPTTEDEAVARLHAQLHDGY